MACFAVLLIDFLWGFAAEILYMIGMSIVSQALIDAGYIEHIKGMVLKSKGLTERKIILIFIIVFAFVSAIFQGIVIMLMIMPVICALERDTGGKISRKQMYMPLGFAALFGGNFSIIGSSSMLNAVSQVEQFADVKVSLFAPTSMAVFTVAGLFLAYLIFGYSLQKRVFTFNEPPIPFDDYHGGDGIGEQGWKKKLSLAVFIGCIAGFVSGIDTGYVSMIACCILLVFHVIDVKRAFQSVDWPVVFTVTGCIAIGKGVEYSGAGAFIANKIIELAGPLGKNAWLMCVVMLFISTLLSNFMSNNAAVTISVPIALSIATILKADPVIFAVACGVGVNLSVSTPISTNTIAVTTSAGYRFSDYIRVGGLMNLIAVGTAALALKLFYF